MKKAKQMQMPHVGLVGEFVFDGWDAAERWEYTAARIRDGIRQVGSCDMGIAHVKFAITEVLDCPKVRIRFTEVIPRQ